MSGDRVFLMVSGGAILGVVYYVFHQIAQNGLIGVLYMQFWKGIDMAQVSNLLQGGLVVGAGLFLWGLFKR